jgi:glycosyltransferase involved in cell wall biosynthesis
MSQRKRLAIITTHPIQYNAPFFRKLAETGSTDMKVFYTWDKGSGRKHDPGFGKAVEWDIPLLEGYAYTFVPNVSTDPGSRHYKGIVCPTLIAEVEQFHPDAILVYGWNFHAHLKAMRYFKGKVPVWFRGDSTLLDYDFQRLKEVFKKSQEDEQLAVGSGQWAIGNRQWAKEQPNPSGTESLNPGIFESLNSKRNHFTSYKSKSVITPFLRGWGYLKYNLRKIYLTHIYKNVDKAFYVGTNNKAYYLAHGLKENQLVPMPHAVDNEFFSTNAEERDADALAWRRDLGIGDDDFIVLFAGKFEPKKNPEVLIRAIIALNEPIQHEDTKTRKNADQKKLQDTFDVNSGMFKSLNFGIHLIMVGNGILEANLKMLATDKPYIHFLPFQNQQKMPVVYRMGDVYCLPSVSETWGLGINEAMACGRPAITSHKVGGAIDLIREKETGLMFTSGNMKELGEKLRLASQIFQAKKKSSSIHEFIYTKFSLSRNAAVLEKELEQLK